MREEVRGGRDSFDFEYTTSLVPGTTTSYNSWAMRTVETLPDGNRRTVYSNLAGMTILTKLEELATGKTWFQYRRFRADGRPTLAAEPSAIANVIEPTPGSPALVVSLRQGDGLVYLNEYYPDTVPGSGAVATYQRRLLVQKGELGAGLPTREATYHTHGVGAARRSTPLPARHVFPPRAIPPQPASDMRISTRQVILPALAGRHHVKRSTTPEMSVPTSSSSRPPRSTTRPVRPS